MLSVKKLNKNYDNNVVLKNISFEVADGDILAIVGPSGSGKSTLLRCLNMLEAPTSGSVIFENVNLTKKKSDLVMMRRKIGMVFQQFNLFNHLTVLDNLILAPRKLKIMESGRAKRRAYELLDIINLKDKADSYPRMLSGGEKQRVATVRTLMMEPDIILFDEPTSALDPLMVGEVLDLIKDIAKSGKTMVIVSHEMRFVKKVATRVIYLEKGKILFNGSKDEFFKSNQDKIKEFLKGH